MPELRHEEGFVSSPDGLRLFWQAKSPAAGVEPKAHIAFVHGYADHSGRHRRTLEHLAANGYAVTAIDYRGHGQSDGRRGHVKLFGDFIADLQLLVDRVKARANGKKVFIVSHSHGGLISALYGMSKPAGIEGMVFSAPLFGLAFKPPPVKIAAARVIGTLVPFFPFGNELKPEQLSRNPEHQRETARDPLYNHVTTPGWYFEAMRSWKDALRRANEFTLPAIVMHSNVDPINDVAGTREFFDKITSSDKTLKLYDGMMHELFNDVGYEQVYADMVGWLDKHSA